MKFWRGKPTTMKEGQYGTVDDEGFVPDSDPATQAEYDAWVAAQPVPEPIITQLQTDIASLSFASLGDANTKLRAILQRVRQGER